MPVGSGSGFKNSDLLDPDPAENGPDPHPCPVAIKAIRNISKVTSKNKTLFESEKGRPFN